MPNAPVRHKPFSRFCLPAKSASSLAGLLIAVSLASVVRAQSTSVAAARPKEAVFATEFAGADIGAQTNAAIAAALAVPGVGGATVRIPPGTYHFAATIRVLAGVRLELDAGAVLMYSGKEDAIDIHDLNADSGSGVDGYGRATLQGTPAARSGVRVDPGNGLYVHGLRVTGFTNGSAVWDNGGNGIDIALNKLYGNKYGVKLTPVVIPAGGFATNAVHVHENDISSNQWAVWNDGGFCTEALGNTFLNNIFEANSVGDLYLNWERGTLVQGNYFESNVPVAIQVGKTHNAWQVAIKNNYFTTPGTGVAVELGYGVGFDVSDNAEFGAVKSGCFVNIAPGPNGGNGGVHGFGTNAAATLGVGSAHEFCNKGVPIAH